MQFGGRRRCRPSAVLILSPFGQTMPRWRPRMGPAKVTPLSHMTPGPAYVYMQAFGSRSGVMSISPASPSPAACECLAAAQAGGRGWSWPLALTLSALSCWSRWRLVTLAAAGRSRSAGSRFRPSRPRPCPVSGHGREADGRQPGRRSGAHSSPRPAYGCSRSGMPRRAHMSRILAPDHLSPGGWDRACSRQPWAWRVGHSLMLR